MNSSTAISPTEATDMGYEPLTVGYAIPRQQAMLDGVIEDMTRGAIEAVLVDIGGHELEVWRKGMIGVPQHQQEESA